MIIGVTGGIGAGKSSVSNILRSMGALVIDADKISRHVVEPNQVAWLKIKQAFGSDVFREDNTLDRKKLAGIVFVSKEKKLLLESIIHTEVVSIIKERIDSLQKQDYNGMIVLDVPIPVENGFLDTVDRVWVVVSDDELRIKRIINRGGISREDAENRIKSQLTQDEYKELAHDIIENNGSLDELREKVEALYAKTIKDKNK